MPAPIHCAAYTKHNRRETAGLKPADGSHSRYTAGWPVGTDRTDKRGVLSALSVDHSAGGLGTHMTTENPISAR
jgi:hypothetical protein